jgi:hypothetical protein
MGIMNGDDTTPTDGANASSDDAGGATTNGSRFPSRSVDLPPLMAAFQQSASRGEIHQVEGTNVIRVPFGVRQARRVRPERPEHWATLVLPFQLNGPNPTPPQAA